MRCQGHWEFFQCYFPYYCVKILLKFIPSHLYGLVQGAQLIHSQQSKSQYVVSCLLSQMQSQAASNYLKSTLSMAMQCVTLKDDRCDSLKVDSGAKF